MPLKNFHWKSLTTLSTIIIISVILRLIAAFYLGDTVDPIRQARIQDQVSYNALARSLLAGKGYSFEQNWYPFTPANTPTAHWSFLYPLFLAGVYFLVGYHPLAARVVQVLIVGVLSPWLFFKFGSRLGGKKVGLLSAFLGAVYLYFIYYDAALMTESFFLIGVLAMINLTMRIPENEEERLKKNTGLSDNLHLNHYTYFYWILIGIILGITALLRQTILLWVPFLLVWIYGTRRSSLQWWKPILALGVMGLFIFPWTVRNYIIYHGFLPLNSNAGYAIYSANHPNQGTHFDQDYAAPLPADLVDKGLNEAQWNSVLTQRGLQFIFQDPRRYILLSLNRVKVYFNFWFSPESDLASNLLRVLSYGLYLPFFIYGLFLSRVDWRRYSLLYLFAFIYSAMHILNWAGIRYRLPVDVVLMPFAAIAITNIAQHIILVLNKRTQPLSNL
jgi:hypothetical protein